MLPSFDEEGWEADRRLRHGFQSSRRSIFLVCSSGRDPDRIIGLRPLQSLPSSQGARIQTSRSSSVVRITGIAFG